MPKTLLAAFAIMLVAGCARPGAGKKGEAEIPSRADAKGKDAIAQLERLLPDYQEAVRQSLPDVIAELKGVDSRFTTVIAYGSWLEDHAGGNVDGLTIHSDAYWEAYITMSMDNPAVFFSRLFLLITDGRLARAEYVKIFTAYHMNHKKESDRQVFEFIQNNDIKVSRVSNAMVDKGVASFDKGDKDIAMRYYSEALAVYPKDPRANYEIGLTQLVENIKTAFADSQAHTAYFAKVRSYDPFYTFAYQGEKSIAMKMPIVMQEIEPSLKTIASAKPGVADFRKFAAGCEKIGEWELAAYAYHFIVGMTMTREKGFDPEAVKCFTRCLAQLGAKRAAASAEENYAKYNALDVPKKK